MDRYTLMLMVDERSPVRRFQVSKLLVRRSLWGAALLVLLLAGAGWDYWRLRAEHTELARLRVENVEQREQVVRVEYEMKNVESQLERVQELERKVRIIANLPGAAAIGGEGVADLVPPGAATDEPGVELALPVGVPAAPVQAASDGDLHEREMPVSSGVSESAADPGAKSASARPVFGLGSRAEKMLTQADWRANSLESLLDQLEDKRLKLASMPSIWPARGWLTSHFGPRVSPFTGRRHMHMGIDIASREGTPIVSPGHARVRSVGRKGPLGNALVLDHGFGVRTVYGHTQKIFVKAGQVVERGQKIAAMGSTGRSTGPHLHYVVERNGKPVDPLNYIFD